MSRRRSKNNSSLNGLILLLALFIQLVIILLYRLLAFIYDLITFYTSGYKEKSGNSFLNTYFNKGNYGEFVLFRKVCRIFGKEGVLTNLYLENVKTDNTEIDVLAVTNKGIYVFEMKNYAGYIYGSQFDQQWTQVLNKWSKYKFYNPIKQNYAHTKAVENFLGVSIDKIIPVIVFSNRSKLSKINVEKDQHVYQYKAASRFLKNHTKKSEILITDAEKEYFLQKLLIRSNMSEEIKLTHIEQVKLIQDEK